MVAGNGCWRLECCLSDLWLMSEAGIVMADVVNPLLQHWVQLADR